MMVRVNESCAMQPLPAPCILASLRADKTVMNRRNSQMRNTRRSDWEFIRTVNETLRNIIQENECYHAGRAQAA